MGFLPPQNMQYHCSSGAWGTCCWVGSWTQEAGRADSVLDSVVVTGLPLASTVTGLPPQCSRPLPICSDSSLAQESSKCLGLPLPLQVSFGKALGIPAVDMHHVLLKAVPQGDQPLLQPTLWVYTQLLGQNLSQGS